MKKQLDKDQIKEAKKLGYKGGYMIGDLIEFIPYKTLVSKQLTVKMNFVMLFGKSVRKY